MKEKVHKITFNTSNNCFILCPICYYRLFLLFINFLIHSSVLNCLPCHLFLLWTKIKHTNWSFRLKKILRRLCRKEIMFIGSLKYFTKLSKFFCLLWLNTSNLRYKSLYLAIFDQLYYWSCIVDAFRSQH